jgi:uncharacterized protein YjbI with pentapeptide repeats
MSTTPKPSHAAGNILNMLVHLGADLTGYDFSGLAVWQAYVQGVELSHINFSAAISGASTDHRDFSPISAAAVWQTQRHGQVIAER